MTNNSNAQQQFEVENNPATAFNSIVQGSLHEDFAKILADGSAEITDPVLIRQIADAVYRLLLEDLRIGHERQGLG